MTTHAASATAGSIISAVQSSGVTRWSRRLIQALWCGALLGSATVALAQSSGITVRAWATLAANVGPQMELRVNGTLVGSTEVRAGSYQNYSFPAVSVPAGAKVEVVFNNDAFASDGDRNLFVESISVNGSTIAATASGVVFDRGPGPQAFDGVDVMPGLTTLYWNGALRFQLTGGGTTTPPVTTDTPPAGYSRCANEGGSCHFTGTANVVYGALGTWTSPRSFTGGTPCTNAVFGDPLSGTGKACYFQQSTTPPVVTTDTPPAGYSRCASENQNCAFTGTASVVYGALATWTAPRNFTGSTACSNAVFGDPLSGTGKACYMKPVTSPPTPLSLNLSIAGTGGVGFSDGSNCSASCSKTFNSGSTVTLAAAPSAGYTFAGWGGACAGTSTTCTVTMDSAKNVSANFAVNAPTTKTVSLTITGIGGVGFSDGSSCSASCTKTFNTGSNLTLVAAPSTGYAFTGWSGACSGTGTCSLSLQQNASVGATFTVSTAPPTLPDGSLAWSNPATWGGTLPPAGAEVVIPVGKVITLDVDSPSLAGLRIAGTLRFARANVSLTAGYIELTGALEIGTAINPFTNKATITLTGQPQTTNDGVARGLNVRGGRLELYGVSPQPVWTKLNDHANVGAAVLTLKDSTSNWKVGDTIALAPTDFYGIAQTERLTVGGSNGNQLALSTPVAKFRWGKLQYVTSGGMSLTPQAGYTPPALPAPTVLDERAAVGNLSRNIVIQGANDAAWANSGFGAHVMIMNLTSRIAVDGVEFRRVGQAGVTARYPFHWHMLSYNTAGQTLGDATGHIIKNSSIWNSTNRCVVIHGTNGVQVRNNICQDIKGHAYFLEDAVERRNVLDGNLALQTYKPDNARLLQVHEGDFANDGGSSGFWITNPDNTVTNNHAGDAHGLGFWLAYPSRPLGLSANVPTQPVNVPHGTFESNTAHSTRSPGIMLDGAPVDAAGNVNTIRYDPMLNEVVEWGKEVPFTLKGNTVFKGLAGAYRNRTSVPTYLEWVVADNSWVQFAGQTSDGLLARTLLIGTSLNNTNTPPVPYTGLPQAGLASYHSTLSMQFNTFVNFAMVDGKPSGAFTTDDYYIRAVDKGTARNGGSRFINTNPGYRVRPPALDGLPINNRNWTLAGALWDLHGYWGPAGNFWVYDVPFLTAGATCQQVVPAGRNGVSCNGEYYGVNNFNTDFDTTPYNFWSPVLAIRQDANGAEIGRWSVLGEGSTSTFLPGMRHFAARSGGRYVLSFPNRPLPKDFTTRLENVYRPTDSFLLGVSYDGSVNVTGFISSIDNGTAPRSWAFGTPEPRVRWFQMGTSLAAVMADSTGSTIWQDKANNLVWVKVQGGLFNRTDVPYSEQELYHPYTLNLYRP